jgi:hypothetical protein
MPLEPLHQPFLTLGIFEIGSQYTEYFGTVVLLISAS